MSEFSSHHAVEEPIDTVIQVLHGNHEHVIQWVWGELPGGDLIYGDRGSKYYEHYGDGQYHSSTPQYVLTERLACGLGCTGLSTQR